jgi:uncharacterized membrane protein YkvA (DUF1232 family)
MQEKALRLYQARIDQTKPGDEARIRRLFPRAIRRLPERATGVGWLDGMIEQVKLLYKMLFDRELALTWETKASIIAALDYFISPDDAVPDAIPVVGWIDDALVVMFAIHSVRAEILRYATLEARRRKSAPRRAAKRAPAKPKAEKRKGGRKPK